MRVITQPAPCGCSSHQTFDDFNNYKLIEGIAYSCKEHVSDWKKKGYKVMEKVE